jgi:uncharacterized delta-60 repeat protein
MRRLVLGALFAGLSACNLITGIGDFTADAQPTCTAPECQDGSAVDGGESDSPFDTTGIPDVQKDGDDEGPGGFPDLTFGTGGIITSTAMSKAYAVAIRADGKIVVLGQSGNVLALMRLDANGKPEPFGTSNKLDLPQDNGTGGDLSSFGVNYGAGIAIDGLGKVLACGSVQNTVTITNPDGTTSTTVRRHAFAARVGTDDLLDPGFGGNGKYRSSEYPASAVAIAPLATNDAYLVGSASGDELVVWKLGADGKLVTTGFGSSGRAEIDFSTGSGNVETAALSPTGTLYLAAEAGSDFGVAALGPDGTPVASFGTNGTARMSLGTGQDTPRAIALHDDKIIVGGDVQVSDGGSIRQTFGIARFNANGTPDTTFGQGGKITIGFGSNTTAFKEVIESLRAVAVDSKGRVVTAGYVSDKPFQGSDVKRAVVARLLPDGTPDPKFGTLGRYTFGTQNADYVVTGMVRQADGKLVIVGYLDGDSRFFVARIVN